MTREEAIKEIEHTVKCCKMYLAGDDPWIIALNIAVAALRAQADKPPNDPLTLEELREMDGEPVFCDSKVVPEDSAWGIVCLQDGVSYVRTMQNKGHISRYFYLTSYGSAWLAYRRKPEEGTTS